MKKEDHSNETSIGVLCETKLKFKITFLISNFRGPFLDSQGAYVAEKSSMGFL